jgi:4-hydroxy-tetrahydrodipicolinate synthase
MSLYDPAPNKRPAPANVMDLRGLNPAPVTVFDSEGKVDWAANADLAKWLAGKEGVKSLVILGHAGEGTFLTTEEQVRLIEVYVEALDGKIPVIAGITGTIGVQTALGGVLLAIVAGHKADFVPHGLPR